MCLFLFLFFHLVVCPARAECQEIPRFKNLMLHEEAQPNLLPTRRGLVNHDHTIWLEWICYKGETWGTAFVDNHVVLHMKDMTSKENPFVAFVRCDSTKTDVSVYKDAVWTGNEETKQKAFDLVSDPENPRTIWISELVTGLRVARMQWAQLITPLSMYETSIHWNIDVFNTSIIDPALPIAVAMSTHFLLPTLMEADDTRYIDKCIEANFPTWREAVAFGFLLVLLTALLTIFIVEMLRPLPRVIRDE